MYLLSKGRGCPLLSTTEELQILDGPCPTVLAGAAEAGIRPAAADEAAGAPSSVLAGAVDTSAASTEATAIQAVGAATGPAGVPAAEETAGLFLGPLLKNPLCLFSCRDTGCFSSGPRKSHCDEACPCNC